MARKTKQDPQQPAAPVARSIPAARKRLPFADAKAHNVANVLVGKDGTAQAADVALTAKGTNPKKLRVYGYDNLAEGNGRVPKEAALRLVEGFAGTPRGVSDAQWAALREFDGKAVSAAYDGGIASRTVRRAYRAGAIRFAK